MKISENNTRYWNPLPYVSLDKTLNPYRGGIGMKQYNSSKTAKYGLSLYDAKVSNMYSTLAYTSKPEVIGEYYY